MKKVILLTGATDGIGLETAKTLIQKGHTALLHGRNPEKLERVVETLSALPNAGHIESYIADLSNMADVKKFAIAVSEDHNHLDVLINNAGIFKTENIVTKDGFDIRFAVNTFAPYFLTKKLLPLLRREGRIINLSSAAQSPINLEALSGRKQLADMDAYAQSKLALTMWSRHMAMELEEKGPTVIVVNPGSLLASKMVQEGFGVAGSDISIGANILVQAALSDKFANVSGEYFDNDIGEFTSPHIDALDAEKIESVVNTIKICLSSTIGE